MGERVRLADLFRRPDRVFLTDLYLEAMATTGDEAGDRPIGLLIPFNGYRGEMVIHNGAFDTGDRRLQYPVPGDAPPYRLTAEPFLQLLAYLATGDWCPDDTGEKPLLPARPDPVKELIENILKNWCKHLNGLPLLVVEEVLARLPVYCEEHRVTMTARSRKKAAGRKSAKTKTESTWTESTWG